MTVSASGLSSAFALCTPFKVLSKTASSGVAMSVRCRLASSVELALIVVEGNSGATHF